MISRYLLILISSLFLSYSFSQGPSGDNCFDARPFCSDQSYIFPNAVGTNSPNGPNYGCLSSQPAPIWYYLKIGTSGTIQLSVSQEGQAFPFTIPGVPNPIVPTDVDFAMWGPFSSVQDGCNQIMSGNLPPTQCSFSGDASETIGLGMPGGYGSGATTPPAAQVGEYYIVLLTNYEETNGTISLSQTGGTGATDCSIVIPCAISALTATPGACVPATNTFSVTGSVSFNDAPSTGTLIVEDCNGNSTTLQPPFNSPISYTIANIPSDGASCAVTAYFSDEPNCTRTSNAYQNAQSCGCDPSINVHDLTICNGEQANLNNAVTPVAGVNVTFHANQQDADNGTNVIATTTSTAGTYWIRAQNATTPSCFTVYQVVVTVVTVSYTSSTTDDNCSAGTGSIVLSANGGTGPYSYSINNGTTSQNNGQFNNVVGGSYQILIKDANGCEATGSVNVPNAGAPTVQAPQDMTVCLGNSVTLTATNPDNATLSWDNGVLDGVSFTPTSEGTTTYTVTATANGCSATDQVIITVITAPEVVFTANKKNGCKPLSVTFTNQTSISNANCKWDFGDGQSMEECGTVTHVYNQVGDYNVTLTVSVGEGCKSDKTETNYIHVTQGPTANFDASPTQVDLNNTVVEFENNSQNATTYKWDFGDGSSISNEKNESHAFPDSVPGNYQVVLTAIDNLGCTDTAMVTIYVNPIGISYGIPNVFTPNNDGSNDVFKLINPQGIRELNIKVLNRWGIKVFESTEIDFEWNGHRNNTSEKCSDGVYYYTITFKDTAGEKYLESGFIHLIDGK